MEKISVQRIPKGTGRDILIICMIKIAPEKISKGVEKDPQ
jgi:hypothetical protein